MKVLHVEAGQNLYGGARQVAFLLQGLRQAGTENVLVAPAGSDIARFATEQAIPCRTTSSAGDLDLGFFWQMKAIMKQERPDIVHLHSRRGADVLGGLAAGLNRLPTILSRRVDNPEPKWQVALKYRLYDHIITISEGIRRVLLAEGVPAQKITCIHSAVDAGPYQHPASREAFLHTFGLPPRAFTLGMIAQLIRRKGHRYLLNTLPVLTRRYPDLYLLIFGKGPLESELKLMVHENDLQERVLFTGFRDDMERWLGCLDLVVHPALIEGLGVALLQAAAAGVPVIASRTGGIPEIVEHETNGLLVEPGDSAGLQQAIERLINAPAERRRMQQAARMRVADSFSLEHMIAGNLAIYHKVLNA
ncbi:MAG: glycosyltransferase [Thiothrix sp.]|nr:glycosyltransferase [Thiothrix sp.]HPQ96139.1 glycosyltransferase [Thiolinea sp.]